MFRNSSEAPSLSATGKYCDGVLIVVKLNNVVSLNKF